MSSNVTSIAKKASKLAPSPVAAGIRSMSTRTGQTIIHRLVEEQGTLLLPGVHDDLAACVVKKNGFKAGFITGFGVSASHLGKPDFGFFFETILPRQTQLLTTAEMTEVASRVCNASLNVACIVDAGAPLNVQRVVKDLIKAGANGIFLEDQLWPKKCAHVAAEEHATKIAVARDAIGDANMFLVARTDARSVTGLDDAIGHANLYYEAEADGLFAEAPQNDEELKRIGQEVKGWLKIANMIEGGKTLLHTPAEFYETKWLVAQWYEMLSSKREVLGSNLIMLKKKKFYEIGFSIVKL